LESKWSKLQFGSDVAEQQDNRYLFSVDVSLADLDPEAVSVELYAQEQGGEPVVTHRMARGERVISGNNAFTYQASLQSTRPVADYTPRIVANHQDAIVPLEAPYILWHESPSWQ